MTKYPNLEIIEKISEDNLPGLSTVTLAALELFSKKGLPKVELPQFKNPVIAGSGNAKVTAQILYSGKSAVYAEESNYKEAGARKDVDGAIVFSASGSKHAPLKVQEFQKHKLDTYLETNTQK